MRRPDSIEMGDTPIALSLAGAKVNKLVMSQRAAEKIMEKKGDQSKTKHFLEPETVKKILRELSDPIMLFTVRGYPGSISAMLSLKDQHGANIMVAIDLDNTRDADKKIINEITTAFGRNVKDSNPLIPDHQWYLDMMNDGNVLYINTEKASQWMHEANLTPVGRATIEKLSQSVPTEADLVKLKAENLRADA